STGGRRCSSTLPGSIGAHGTKMKGRPNGAPSSRASDVTRSAVQRAGAPVEPLVGDLLEVAVRPQVGDLLVERVDQLGALLEDEAVLLVRLDRLYHHQVLVGELGVLGNRAVVDDRLDLARLERVEGVVDQV